jgi:LacI family transcriptional regulator
MVKKLQTVAKNDKKTTSAEIARLAGVSRSTVSRVINGYDNVPEDTRQKVMEVIESQEYYPILSGQTLAGKNTGTLGFFWVSATSIANDIQCSSFFVNVTEAAASLGYLVLTCIVGNLAEEKNVKWIKKIFMQERIDAGIFIGIKNNEPLIEELVSKGKIVGLFSHFHPSRHEPNRVSVNFERDTGEKVIDYVFRMGHRKVTVIDGDSDSYGFRMRRESFVRGMMQHGLTIRPDWMLVAEPGECGGYYAARKLLKNCRAQDDYPTVICACNDAIAFDIYKALEEEGIKIPGQISVVGIDGHENGRLIAPQLTTFAFDFQKLFYSLVDRTIKIVEGRENIPLTEFFPSRLVERDSCRRVTE